MGSKILDIEYYLPENIVTNNDIALKFPDWNSEKIESKLGILERRVANLNETSLDLAYRAALRLFLNYENDDVDGVIFCTQSSDYYLPTSACILQHKLGLKKECIAFDYNFGCSGYIYGLMLAKSIINSGAAKKILLLTGETYSKHIAETDVNNITMFGDAGSATLIVHSDKEDIFNFILGTDGSGASNLIVKKNGMRDQTSDNTENGYLYMNGPEIFNFTLRTIPDLIEKCLSENDLNQSDVDFFIFHQANNFLLDFLRKKIGIDVDRFFMDKKYTGNTVSNTIPIALKSSSNNGKISAGDKVCLCGFGVGYSWGATIIRI